jgi:hypothetical protein
VWDGDVFFKHTQDLILMVREDDVNVLRVSVALHTDLYNEEDASKLPVFYVQVLVTLATKQLDTIGHIDVLGPEVREKCRNLAVGPDIAGDVFSYERRHAYLDVFAQRFERHGGSHPTREDHRYVRHTFRVLDGVSFWPPIRRPQDM